mmetsp:Transcript_31117/g.74792  ORF Transcript_31117/g.74792 Transcript_31117/m.74792 type:complete len:85 (-) Transcript_31117:1278-1532(-)
MGPVKAFSSKNMPDNDDSNPSSVGIVPVSLFDASASAESRLMPISLGMVPDNPFSQSSKLSSDVSKPISVGIVDVKLLLRKTNS